MGILLEIRKCDRLTKRNVTETYQFYNIQLENILALLATLGFAINGSLNDSYSCISISLALAFLAYASAVYKALTEIKRLAPFFGGSIIVLTTNVAQRSLRKLGRPRLRIRMKFVEWILVHPKVRLTAFLLVFLATIRPKT